MANGEYLGLRTAIYKVDNLEEAKDWYKNVLGKAPYFDEPFYVGFNLGGFELGLLPRKKATDKPGTTVIAYWGVDNIKHSYQRLLELGATAYEKPENVGGDIQVATVKDPWYNVFGLIYNPSFNAE